jgi:hypothetical protein
MKLTRILLIVLLLAASTQLFADVDLKISGYLDARAGVTLGSGTEQIGFGINSSRVIFGAKIADWISATVHLGTNPWGGNGLTPALGAAFITLGDPKELSLVVGRFPVPMGIANNWFLSPANAFAFAPALISTGITPEGQSKSPNGILSGTNGAGWVDQGIMGKFVLEDFLTVQVYAVSGNAGRALLGSIDPTVGVQTDKGIAGGLRAVITPIEGLNLGLNYCLNAHGVAADNVSILAGDVEFKIGPVALTYEYLAAMPKFDFDNRQDAWFAQFEFDLEEIAGIPISPGVRYDYLTSYTAVDGADYITIQAVYKFEKALRIGLSFRTSKQEEDQLMLQVLTMF